MRILGVDLGTRRIGLAISDPSGILARPLMTLEIESGDEAAVRVSETIEQLSREEDGLTAVVVGLPSRLDGSVHEATDRVRAFIDELRKRTQVRIATQDERLSSREAESRLALRVRDWRKRKTKLDAAAAAVILQDYLDGSR